METLSQHTQEIQLYNNFVQCTISRSMRKRLSRSYETCRRYVWALKLYLSFPLTRPREEKLSIERQMSLMRACHRQKKVRNRKAGRRVKTLAKERRILFFFLLSSFLPVTSDHPCKHPSATWQPFRKKVWPKARYLACGQSFRRRLVSSPRHSLSSFPPRTLIFDFLFYTTNGRSNGTK